jgi:hypothetical protein
VNFKSPPSQYTWPELIGITKYLIQKGISNSKEYLSRELKLIIDHRQNQLSVAGEAGIEASSGGD